MENINGMKVIETPRLPNASVTQTICQEIGLGRISVIYCRPNRKNREIFGGVVPFEMVWRTGANTATEISFSEQVKLDGHEVQEGTYALFTIPGKNEWTIILNKDVKSWGAFNYNENNDVLRFRVKASRNPEKQETLTILFTNSTRSSADLQLVWDDTVVTVHVDVDLDTRICENIEQLMQIEHPGNVSYFNAIQYYFENNKDIDKALGWIARAKKDVPGIPAYFLFESRFLLRRGDKAGAIVAAEAGIQLSRELNFDEYIKLNMEALDFAKES